MDGLDPRVQDLILRDIIIDDDEHTDRIEAAALVTLLTIFQQHHEQQKRKAATTSATDEDESGSGESSRDCSESVGEVDEEEEEEEEEWTEEADVVDGYSEPSAPAHRPALGKRRRSPSPAAAPTAEASHGGVANGVKRLRRLDSGSPSPLPAARDARADPTSTWIKILNQTALRATGRVMDKGTEDMVRQMDIKTRNDVIHATLDFRARFAGQISQEDSAAVFAFLQANPSSCKKYNFEDPDTKAKTFSAWIEQLTGRTVVFKSERTLRADTITGQLHRYSAKLRQPEASGAAEKRAVLKPHLLRQIDKESQGPVKDRVRLWLDNILP